MRLFGRLFGGQKDTAGPLAMAVDGGRHLQSSHELEKALTDEFYGHAPHSAIRPMQMTAVLACVRLIAGGVANIPFRVVRVNADGTKEDASRTETAGLLMRRPNARHRRSQFIRLGTMHLMLRGNFYALKVRGGNGHISELLPIHPDRIRPEEDVDTGVVRYVYTRARDGRRFDFTREQILHIYLWSLDGIVGISPIHLARQSIEDAIALERFGGALFRNGARPAGIFTTEKRLGPEGRANIAAALEEYRADGLREGKELILEDGFEYQRLSLNAVDAEYIAQRKMSKGDVYELYGIPLHMTALADKQSNWGTGVEEHNRQFIQYTLADYMTAWEEALNLDVISAESNLHVSFDREQLVAGDLQARTVHYTSMMQWGALSPDEVRAKLDMNPRADGEGGQYYPPPNMTRDEDGGADEPAERQAAGAERTE